MWQFVVILSGINVKTWMLSIHGVMLKQQLPICEEGQCLCFVKELSFLQRLIYISEKIKELYLISRWRNLKYFLSEKFSGCVLALIWAFLCQQSKRLISRLGNPYYWVFFSSLLSNTTFTILLYATESAKVIMMLGKKSIMYYDHLWIIYMYFLWSYTDIWYFPFELLSL